MTDFDLEKEFLSRERERDPAPYQLEEQPGLDTIMEWVGITALPPGRPRAYLKLVPEDFIVEEIGLDRKIISIEPGALFDPYATETVARGDLWVFELVKRGLSTIEAVNEVAHLLGVHASDIGYAGIKDKVAITGQRLTVRVPKEKFEELHFDERLKIQNVAPTARPLVRGGLNGNRFTITLRTDGPVDVERIRTISQELGERGFVNFYGQQRFGTMGLISELRFRTFEWGRLLARGEYEACAHDFLTAPAYQAAPVIMRLRAEAKEAWGDFARMRKIFDTLPYTFRYERDILMYLVQNPHDWVGALKSMYQQTELWIMSYTSYLANLLMSQIVLDSADEPDRIPIAFSNREEDTDPYRGVMEADGTLDFLERLAPLGFHPEHHSIAMRVKVKPLGEETLPYGVRTIFDLPKGAYATIYLAHLFSLYGGAPVPGWVDKGGAQETGGVPTESEN